MRQDVSARRARVPRRDEAPNMAASNRCAAAIGFVALAAALGFWLRAVMTEVGDGPDAATVAFELVRASNVYAMISIAVAAGCAIFLGVRWLRR